MDVTGQILTDETTVNAYDSATSTVPATVMTLAIARASESICRAMGHRIINPKRALVQRSRLRAGMSPHIACSEYPVLSSPAIVVTMNGEVLTVDDDYVVELGSGLVTRLSDDEPINWEGGTVKLEYEAGYADLASVPGELKHLATLQTVFELWKISEKYVGVTQRDPEAGTTFTLEADGLLPSVREAIKRNWMRTSGGDLDTSVTTS